MKAKTLGRSELLTWINTITQSDYPKIESWSDGIAFAQIIDAFYTTVTPEIMKLRLNSKDKEEWEKNFSLLNEMLLKIKSYKQIDPRKWTKSNFSTNFEFWQFLYDFIYKTFNSNQPKSYKGLKRRCDIIKSQYGKRALNDIKKYWPSHWWTNDILLQLDKEKYFMENLSTVIGQQLENEGNNTAAEEDNNEEGFYSTLDKYKGFFKLWEEDLNSWVDKNKGFDTEIKDIEGEKEYYLEKILKVIQLCERKKTKVKNENGIKICDDLIGIIQEVPDDLN